MNKITKFKLSQIHKLDHILVSKDAGFSLNVAIELQMVENVMGCLEKLINIEILIFEQFWLFSLFNVLSPGVLKILFRDLVFMRTNLSWINFVSVHVLFVSHCLVRSDKNELYWLEILVNLDMQAVVSHTVVIGSYVPPDDRTLISGLFLSHLFKLVNDPFTTNLSIGVNVNVDKFNVPVWRFLMDLNLGKVMVLVHGLLKCDWWMVFEQFVDKTKLCVDSLEEQLGTWRDITDKWRQVSLNQRSKDHIQTRWGNVMYWHIILNLQINRLIFCNPLLKQHTIHTLQEQYQVRGPISQENVHLKLIHPFYNQPFISFKTLKDLMYNVKQWTQGKSFLLDRACEFFDGHLLFFMFEFGFEFDLVFGCELDF